MLGPFAGIDGILSVTPLQSPGGPVQLASTNEGSVPRLAAQSIFQGAQLSRNVSNETPMLAKQEASIRTANAKSQTLAAAFAAQQRALASLAATRSRVVALVRKLHGRLTRKEIAAANACTGVGIPITYGQWAKVFLKAIGAPVSQNNLVAMVAWQSAEGTTASWNPLATTYSMPGAGQFNSVGVQNYVSLEQGIQAIALTLQSPGHGYEAILSDLQASADPLVTASAINASDWCYGCAGGQYVLDLVPTVAQYFANFASG
jgi:hypothetical protein